MSLKIKINFSVINPRRIFEGRMVWGFIWCHAHRFIFEQQRLTLLDFLRVPKRKYLVGINLLELCAGSQLHCLNTLR
jgi:hypothetical protein